MTYNNFSNRQKAYIDAVVEHALRTADAAEIEAQGGETAFHEGLVHRLRDPVVHGAARLRVGVQYHRDRRAVTGSWAEAAFEAAFGSGKNYVRHGFSILRSRLSSPEREKSE
mgnify:CR=1 FL=1